MPSKCNNTFHKLVMCLYFASLKQVLYIYFIPSAPFPSTHTFMETLPIYTILNMSPIYKTSTVNTTSAKAIYIPVCCNTLCALQYFPVLQHIVACYNTLYGLQYYICIVACCSNISALQHVVVYCNTLLVLQPATPNYL